MGRPGTGWLLDSRSMGPCGVGDTGMLELDAPDERFRGLEDVT